jgi:hypothetical protein
VSNRWRPTVEEERLLIAAQRAHVRLADPPWIRSTFFTRVAFFILTCMGVGALSGLLEVFARNPHVVRWILGIVAIGLGEALIRTKRLFGSGPEEALWVIGVLALLWAVIDRSGNDDLVFICTLAAIAFAVAGWRLLNPALTTCALLAVVPMIYEKQSHELAAYYCVAVALTAALLLTRSVRRPSWNAALEGAMGVLPVVGYFCISFDLFGSPDRFRPEIAGLFLLVIGAFLFVGLRWRLHAPLIAAMPCLAIVGYECRHLTGLSLEARLIVWGALLFVVAFIAERRLRGRRHGFTSDAAGSADAFGVVELAGVAAAGLAVHQPASTTSGETTQQGGGGTFGGAGASGDY